MADDMEQAQDIGADNLDDISADDDTQADETPPVVAVPTTDDKAATPTDEQFPQHVPVPVDVTDKIYGAFREEFNEDEAASLQRAWGDHAWGNEQVVRAVIRDNPAIDSIYVQNQTETGGLSADGVEHALRYILEQSGETESAFLKKHPELDALYFDHVTADGGITPAGLYRMLHYFGKTAGHKFNYRGQR